jgi:hypothetical protein
MTVAITETTFEGTAAIELRTPALRLIAVSAVGPRIAFFGRPGGENLLLWRPGEFRRGAWDLLGGHRIWVTRPLADEAEETYLVDGAPCDVAVAADGFTLTSAIDAATRTRRGFTVRALDDDRLLVEGFVTNVGPMLYSGGVWGLTCTVPRAGTRYAVPLGDGSAWDAFPLVLFRTWAGGQGGGGFADPQFRVTDDLLVLSPSGVENKRMLAAPRGIVAMSDPARGVTFAKLTEYVRGGAYPLGANVAFYVGPGNFMVEMETMGPEATLKPGETLRHVETWLLRSGALPLDSAAELLGLF